MPDPSVPHLTIADNGPLLTLERHLLDHQAEIENWLRNQWRLTPAPINTSVDLRNSGYKLAPVDTNLFPAGFNNLNPAFMPLCVQAAQSAVDRLLPSAFRTLLVPESHTRNPYYLESLATLRDILEQAGLDVRIGSLGDIPAGGQTLSLASGRELELLPIERQGDRIGVAGFSPCMVILNNDLSSGRPGILEDLEQVVVPPLNLGWSNRLKSVHFAHYRQVATEVAEVLDIDPWLIDPMFENCGEINFRRREGEDCVAEHVNSVLNKLREKYREYGVKQEPFVIIKADSGTYGMAVMAVHNASEIYELNRKQRTRMSAAKGGQEVSSVIVQEGVYTFETWGADNASAEPVVYMIDHHVVGGFYRVHTNKGANESLNAPGARFEPLAFHESCITPNRGMAPDAEPNRFYAYGVIARLAMLAAARELAEQPEMDIPPLQAAGAS